MSKNKKQKKVFDTDKLVKFANAMTMQDYRQLNKDVKEIQKFLNDTKRADALPDGTPLTDEQRSALESLRALYAEYTRTQADACYVVFASDYDARLNTMKQGELDGLCDELFGEQKEQPQEEEVHRVLSLAVVLSKFKKALQARRHAQCKYSHLTAADKPADEQ